MADVKGIFGITTIWCLNHEEPVKMEITQNVEKVKTPFFQCNEYPKCSNRMNIDDYDGLMFKFMDIIGSELPSVDYTNYEFDYRGTRHKYHCKVLKYDRSDIRLGILNRTVLGR